MCENILFKMKIMEFKQLYLFSLQKCQIMTCAFLLVGSLLRITSFENVLGIMKQLNILSSFLKKELKVKFSKKVFTPFAYQL